jgi:hypothetical protein
VPAHRYPHGEPAAPPPGAAHRAPACIASAAALRVRDEEAEALRIVAGLVRGGGGGDGAGYWCCRAPAAARPDAAAEVALRQRLGGPSYRARWPYGSRAPAGQ